jgi:hypothetical protein
MSYRRQLLFAIVILVIQLFVVPLGNAQQPLLQVTYPFNSSTVQEGQTITVTVSADASVQNVTVMTESPLPDAQPTSDPTQFSLTIPTTISPGIYHITAVGFTTSGDVESDPVGFEVERADQPVQVQAEPLLMTFNSVGAQQKIIAYGTYADGTRLVISNALSTQFVSNNTQVATVASTGWGFGIVTATGPGQTIILVQSGSVYYPVSVQVSQLPQGGTAPLVAGVTPGTGVPGVTQVTVTGSGFGSTQGTGLVQLGSLSATSVTSWSDSQIVATVPNGSMSGVVEVDQNGVASNQVPFTTVAPSISSVNPTTGVAGVQVTIAGSSFGSTQGTSTLLFNRATATPTSWSDTSIVTPLPAAATTGNVVAIVSGVPSSGVSFTVVPSITSLSPASGAVGTAITIAGSGFGAIQDTSTVTFNGIAATPTSWSTTSIVVPVPTGATSGNVVVTIGGLATNGVAFTVVSPTSITTLSPTSGAVGASVTITGTNFGSTQGTSTVKFNATTVTTITSWSATSIVAKVPTGATTGNVVVTVSGVASNGSAFTVVAAPSISSLSPTSGAVGASITITGSNFGATQGTSTVKFNTTTATTITSWSATSIVAKVPTGATTGNVVVHASGVDSNGKAFTVLSTPNITSLSPTSGSVGASVTITGTNFGSTQGTSTVKFNATTVTTITSWSATSIVAKVPTGATTGNVVVHASGVDSNGKAFTVH